MTGEITSEDRKITLSPVLYIFSKTPAYFNFLEVAHPKDADNNIHPKDADNNARLLPVSRSDLCAIFTMSKTNSVYNSSLRKNLVLAELLILALTHWIGILILVT